MQVKFKKLHNDAVLPKYMKIGDCGMDLTATTHYSAFDNEATEWHYGTGLAVEIPEGHVGLLLPRSSIYKHGYSLSNSIGCIDSNYRGELQVRFYRLDDNLPPYEVGDRICQLIILPFPKVFPEWADELSTSVRGDGAFGSSGRR